MASPPLDHGRAWQCVFHRIRIFVSIFVVIPKNRSGAESGFLEKQLSAEIRFSDFERDGSSSLLGKLINELSHHVPPDAESTKLLCNRKAHHMHAILEELVNHETPYAMLVIRNHANAISLAQTAQKIFFVPRKLEALCFDVQHIPHIPTNHPPHLNICRIHFLHTW